MGLMECPDCGKIISSKMQSCPKCGCKITNKIAEKGVRKFNRQTKYANYTEKDKKQWESYGHTGRTYEIRDASLSQDEIKILFKKKVLSPEIYSIFNEEMGENRYEKDLTIKKIGQNAKKAGVLMVLRISFTEFALFTKDFIVISCLRSNYEERKYETKMDFPIVIPYSRISKFIITKGESHPFFSDPVYKEQSGDVTKGAIVGAILGGTTGAIIGAAANMPKNVMVSPAEYSSIVKYNVEIELKNHYKNLEFILFYFEEIHHDFFDNNDRWVLGINNELLNTQHSLDHLDSEDEITQICNEYTKKYEEICSNAVDYKLRKKCLDFIKENIDNSKELDVYCSNKDFLLYVYKSIKDNNNQGFFEIQKRLKDVIDNVKKTNTQIKKLQNTLKEAEKEFESLSIFNFKQKKDLKGQISQLKDNLNMLKYDDYPEISKEIYKKLRNISNDNMKTR